MAKEKMTPAQIVQNIAGEIPRNSKTKKEEPKEEKAPVGRTKQVNKPTTLSFVLGGEEYQKLQDYIYQEKANGNRGVSISGLVRSLLEDWIAKNL